MIALINFIGLWLLNFWSFSGGVRSSQYAETVPAHNPGISGSGEADPHQREAHGPSPCPTVVRRDPASIAMGRPARTLFRRTTPPARILRGALGRASRHDPRLKRARGHCQPVNFEDREGA
jgi:hypothetical protein